MSSEELKLINNLEREVANLKLFEVPKRNPTSNIISTFLTINALRAFWPMNSRDEVPLVMDLSAQGRSMSFSGSLVTAQISGLGEYIQVDNTHYLFRNNEVGLNNNAFTFGGWFYFADITPNTFYRIGGKDLAAPLKSWELAALDASGQMIAEVSTDGTAVISARITIPSVGWHFIGMTKASNVVVRAYCDLNSVDQTTGVPAAIIANTTSLRIGNTPTGTGYPNGRVMYWFYTSAFMGIATWTSLFEASRGVFGV